MPKLTVVVQHHTLLNFQQEIKETFIFCVPLCAQLHWTLLKLPVHTVPFLISSGKFYPLVHPLALCANLFSSTNANTGTKVFLVYKYEVQQ